MYQTLYRKYRPRVFDDVCGQEHITSVLRYEAEHSRFSHAYLFCGSRGTGKTTCAKILAKVLNCEHPVNGNPCGECFSCRSIDEGNATDVLEMDAASRTGVDYIRDIQDEISFAPTSLKKRVYIIDEVHMLSTGAFNALLKTLEEPPSYVIFILATTEVHKIPITVLSRCQRYDFRRITLDTITARLKELTEAENMPVEEKALRYVAKAGDGSMRDALSLLDQCAAFHFGETLTYEHVLDVLGAVDNSVFRDLFRAIRENRTKDCILKLEEMVVQGRELSQFVVDFIWFLRNLLLLKTADDAEDLLDMSEDNLTQLREDAALADENALMRYIRVFSELSNQIRFANQKRVLIELAFIKLTKPEMEQSMDSVLERLEKLERMVQEGIPAIPAGGYVPVQNAGMAGDPMMPAGQIPPQAYTKLAYGGSGVPENPAESSGQPAQNPANMQNPQALVQNYEPRTVSLPKAQLEDLNMIRNEWGKIVRDMGMSIRPSFRETVVEPAGDSCLCIVFNDPMNFAIGSRPSVLGDLERYVEQKYGKSLYFKSRVRESGERMDTRYISDEELRENIHMDITIED